MSLAYSRKHWRQIMMLYLRMIACWLEHTRLFIEVYKNNTRRVKMSVSSTKGGSSRGKKEEKSIKARRVRKEGPFVVHRQSIVSAIAKSNGNYIDARYFALKSVRTNSPRLWFIVSSPPSLVMGSRQPTRRKKRHKTKRKKSLSSHSETEHRPRTKLDRLWRYLSGETPTRLQSPFLCVDVRVYVRNQQQIEWWICAREFPFCGSSWRQRLGLSCEKKIPSSRQKFKQERISALGA